MDDFLDGPRGRARFPKNNAPSIKDIVGATSVYRQGWEWISYELYDFLTYPTTGQLQFNFFSTGLQNRTKAQTNLDLNGQLPMNKAFIVQSIECQFISADAPSTLSAPAAAAQINETFQILQNGFAQLVLGDKEYATIAPLMRAPAQVCMDVDGYASDSTTAGAGQAVQTGYATAKGRAWKLAKPVLIPHNSTFGVNVGFDSLLTVANAARLGVVLRGTLIRKSQ